MSRGLAVAPVTQCQEDDGGDGISRDSEDEGRDPGPSYGGVIGAGWGDDTFDVSGAESVWSLGGALSKAIGTPGRDIGSGTRKSPDERPEDR